MRTILSCVAAILLAACAPTRPLQDDTSACVNNEASYECQVERYNKVHAD